MLVDLDILTLPGNDASFSMRHYTGEASKTEPNNHPE